MTEIAEAQSALLAAIVEGLPTMGRRRRDMLANLLDNVVVLAAQDPDPLDLKIADAALAELVEAFEVFAPYRGVRKVTIFGSARTRPDSPIYALAHDFARAIVEDDWMVVTGAGPGIMAAGIHGAGREHSFGVNIRLPFEQGANEFIIDDDKLVEMRYFFTRKVMLTKESSAFAVFPGGFGTLDEVFELLTLLQTGKAQPAPVVLMDTPDGNFWHDWLHFIHSRVVAEGYVSGSDDGFFSIATSADEAREEIRRFYANFHSLRHVGDRTVLRLQQAPTEEQLEEVRRDFGSLLASGDFDVVEAFDVERATNDFPDLPRLSFTFDRQSFGALQRLIHRTNTWVD